MVRCEWGCASSLDKVGCRSGSVSMRCEVDLMRVDLGLVRLICFTGRRSEVLNSGDVDNTAYGRFLLLSEDDVLWLWKRLLGDDRRCCWEWFLQERSVALLSWSVGC